MFNNSQPVLEEELKLLIRATRNELFRFITIEYNHYDLVRRVKHDLVAQYPQRPVHSFNLEDCNPDTFIGAILASKSGLVFIEKFDLMLTENFRSLAIGFNQRRDLFSTLPIQFIVFIPSGEEHLQRFQKIMPDVFSIINPMIQLHQEILKSKDSIRNKNDNYYNFSNIKEAEDEIERIKKRLKTLENIPENTTLIAQLKIILAKTYRFIGDYLHGKLLLEELLAELQTSNFTDFENLIAVVQSNLALVLKDLGDYEGAKILLQKALISDENNFGENHPNTARRYSNLATILEKLGDYEGAKTLLQKALISDENNFGENHPNTLVCYSNLAVILEKLSDYEGAKILLQKAMVSTENIFGENHPNTAVTYSNLAVIHQDLGDYEGAKKLFERAMISNENNLGENHPNTAVTYSNLATVLQTLGDYIGAKTFLQKAYNIYHNHFGDTHPTTKIIKENLDYVQSQIQ